jgi:hypothetical protein
MTLARATLALRKPRNRTHPSLAEAAEALADGRCLYSPVSTCSSDPNAVGLRHREDVRVVLACKAHVGRLRKLPARDLDRLEAELRRAFAHKLVQR